MLQEISSWLSNPVLLGGLAAFSIVAVLASIVLVPRYLAQLPRDFLSAEAPPRHPSLVRYVARNALGVVLVVLGALMLVLPGQGLLTLLVGLLLLDFPGKQRLVRRVLGRPKVLALVNRLRGHRNAPPLRPR